MTGKPSPNAQRVIDYLNHNPPHRPAGAALVGRPIRWVRFFGNAIRQR